VIDNVTANNFLLIAAKAYDKPNAVWNEFEEDINRIQYIKRLLTKYYTTGILKERLILNHLVIFYNVFGPEGTRLLFFKLEHKDLEVLLPFVDYLGFAPPVVYGVNGQDIVVDEYNLDPKAIEVLKELK